MKKLKQNYEIQCKANSRLTDKNEELTKINKELIDLDYDEQERYRILCKINSTIIDKNEELTDKNIIN